MDDKQRAELAEKLDASLLRMYGELETLKLDPESDPKALLKLEAQLDKMLASRSLKRP